MLSEIISLPTPIQGITAIIIFFILWKIRGFYLWIIRGRRYRFLPKYAGNLKEMQSMDWKDFEYLCEELFRARGWKTKCSDKKGADGGIDVYIERNEEKGFVQCKRYKNYGYVQFKRISKLNG